jgi:hypothetical protein
LVRGLSDLGPVADLPSLGYLFLQAQRQVISLPSFERTGALRRVHLQTMRGLRDVGHPTLREAAVGLGSKKKNDAIHALLGLPAPSGPPAWIDLS